MRSTITLNRHGWTMLGLGLGLSVGCLVTRPDPNHCLNLEGDETCAELHPGELTFCSTCEFTASGDGCVAERPDAACYSPCGGRTWVDDDASCLASASSSSGEESTSTGETGTDTEPASSESSTTGPVPCMGNEDCSDAAAPFCEPVSGECVGCDGMDDPDGACAGVDPMAPLCVGGTCVACTPANPVICDDQLLLCDAVTNGCVPCSEHAQCGSGACELVEGRCFPDDIVVHVDGDAGAMPTPDYTSIAAAVDAVDDGTHGVIVVHELDGAGSYQTAGMGLRIDGGKTIALLAAPGEGPIIQGTNMNPGLRVEGAGTVVYTDGLRLRNGDVQGLEVNGAFAWVDRSRIVQNSGGGVLAQGGAELMLRNCFVGDGNTNSTDAITVSGATLTMLYTTVGAAANTGMAARALYCDGGGQADVRNSILVSFDPGPEVDCPGITIADSATEAELGMLIGTWFDNYGTGDFHLTMSSPVAVATTAHWQTGDPTTDIDGDPRPTVDGTADFAGADVP